MLIISFEKDILLGGYGDRIVGLISVYNICKILNRKFGIIWNKENVKKYIDYSKYEIEDNIKVDEVINIIDNQYGLKGLLLSNNNPFPKHSYKIYLNQEISQYLYKNKNISYSEYCNSMRESYRELYKNILVPTDFVMEKINSIIDDKNDNVIGIQIRSGDCYIYNNPNDAYRPIKDPENSIKCILKNIKKDIEKNNSLYKIFITSDYPNIYTLSLDIWDSNQLIYLNEKIHHLDRNPSGDLSKIFIDNYILANYSKKMYISDYSNYGRIAALASNCEDIYDLNCNKLDINKLFSKHENF
jgi:hypothetical protein